MTVPAVPHPSSPAAIGTSPGGGARVARRPDRHRARGRPDALGVTLVHEHLLIDMYDASLNSAGVLLDEAAADRRAGAVPCGRRRDDRRPDDHRAPPGSGWAPPDLARHRHADRRRHGHVLAALPPGMGRVALRGDALTERFVGELIEGVGPGPHPRRAHRRDRDRPSGHRRGRGARAARGRSRAALRPAPRSRRMPCSPPSGSTSWTSSRRPAPTRRASSSATPTPAPTSRYHAAVLDRGAWLGHRHDRAGRQDHRRLARRPRRRPGRAGPPRPSSSPPTSASAPRSSATAAAATRTSCATSSRASEARGFGQTGDPVSCSSTTRAGSSLRPGDVGDDLLG